MTIEINDAVLDQECLAATVRAAITYISDRMGHGVEQARPDRHDKD